MMMVLSQKKAGKETSIKKVVEIKLLEKILRGKLQ